MSADAPLPLDPKPGSLLNSPPEGNPPSGILPSRRFRRRVWIAAVIFSIGLIPVAYWSWNAYRMNREWSRAETSLAHYDLDSAAAQLERYLAERPDDAEGWFLAARTARRRERYADASRFLERSQELGGVTDQPAATRLRVKLPAPA